MRIIDLQPDDEAATEQAAQLLVDGFRENWPDAWPTLESAREEVRGLLQEGSFNRVAVDEDGTLLGWIGGTPMPDYDGHTWELHPLVVRPDRQRQGIGRALVMDLEALVRERGVTTLWLGSDDVTNMTTLSGADLYPNVWEHVANIQNLRGHPYTFYQKLGFAIVGVLPDANGPGKPDIFMAKRVSAP